MAAVVLPAASSASIRRLTNSVANSSHLSNASGIVADQSISIEWCSTCLINAATAMPYIAAGHSENGDDDRFVSKSKAQR